MKKHTKGEWEVSRVTGIVVGVSTKTQNGYCEMICNSILPDTDDEYEKDRETIEANAKIIAAAPDLLEALEDAMDILKSRVWGNQDVSIEEVYEMFPKQAAAIKKATQ